MPWLVSVRCPLLWSLCHADVQTYIIILTQEYTVCIHWPIFSGDGEPVKDPSEEKPESEAEGVEEPVVGEEGESVDSKEEAPKDAEEHIEL